MASNARNTTRLVAPSEINKEVINKAAEARYSIDYMQNLLADLSSDEEIESDDEGVRECKKWKSRLKFEINVSWL